VSVLEYPSPIASTTGSDTKPAVCAALATAAYLPAVCAALATAAYFTAAA
jgi:hypothetical protein